MSEQKTDAKTAPKPEGAAVAKPAAKPSPLPLVGAAVGALVLGSVLGIFVVAPRVVGSRTGAHAAASEGAHAEGGGEQGEEGGGGHGGGGGKHGEKGKAGESVVHKIDNLIVNPAGSQGRRFLMLSVAIELPDSKAEQVLRSQDAKLRDGIIGAIQGQPFDVITSPVGRDSVRVAITRVVRPLVPGAAFVRVYLPQFVLQ